MCDGSAHFVADETEKTVVMSLCSRDGEEQLEALPF